MLPEPGESYKILKPGRYTCKITKVPKTQRFGKATGIIIEFNAISDEDESITPTSILLWPFEDRETGYFPYKILKDKVIKSNEEEDWEGKIFKAEFEVGPHPTKSNQKQHKIVSIEYKEEEEVDEAIVKEEKAQEQEKTEEPPEPEWESEKEESKETTKEETEEDEDDLPF